MTFKKYVQVIRRRWRIAVVALLACVVVALGYFLFYPKTYTADLTFYVSAQTVNNAQSAYQGGLLSEQRASSYVEILSGERVAEELKSSLALPDTVSDISSKIRATAQSDSVVIDVHVDDSDPVRAAAIANGIGIIFPKIVSELEAPSAPGASPPVIVRIVSNAPVPTAPSSAGFRTVMGVGLLLGLVVASSVVLLVESFDNTVKAPEELEEVSGAPLLASIPKLDNSASDSLSERRGIEAYKRLRTNLQFVQLGSSKQIFAVTSPATGDGKSTVSWHMTRELSASGLRTLLVDADLRRPAIARFAGLEHSVGLTSALTGRASTRDCIQRGPIPGLDILTSGPIPPNPSELLGSERMESLAKELRKSYDVVVFDTPPVGPVADTIALGSSVDCVLLVARYGKSTTAQVASAANLFQRVGVALGGVIFVGNPQSRKDDASYYAYQEFYESELGPGVGSNQMTEARRPSPGRR